MKSQKNIYMKNYESPLGTIHLAADGDKLIGLWFKIHKYQDTHLKGNHIVWIGKPQAETNLKNTNLKNTNLKNTDFKNTALKNTDLENIDLEYIDLENSNFNNIEGITRAEAWLDAYFKGEEPEIPIDLLKPEGSEFQLEVLKILCTIDYRKTLTYGEIAKMIAKKRGISKMSAQAVGGAVGHNPISIIIPCHRVVGTNGNLTGYGGGMQKKVDLLVHEGYDMSQFTVPTKGTAL